MVKDLSYHNFSELIGIAQERHNIETPGGSNLNEQILKDYSYYALINGYQRALETDTYSEMFRPGTTLLSLSQIHVFETSLCSDLLQALLAFENKFKNLLQDTVCQYIGIEPSKYLNFKNYKDARHASSLRTVKKLEYIANTKDDVNGATKKFRSEGAVPPWILINELDFGTSKYWYNILPVDAQRIIYNEFNFVGMPDKEFKEFFLQSLNMLNDYRNALAHGNVLNKFNIKPSVHFYQLEYFYPSSVISQEEFNTQHIGKSDTYGLMLLLGIFVPEWHKQILKLRISQDLTFFTDIMPLDSAPMRRVLKIPSNLMDRLNLIFDSLI